MSNHVTGCPAGANPADNCGCGADRAQWEKNKAKTDAAEIHHLYAQLERADKKLREAHDEALSKAIKIAEDFSGTPSDREVAFMIANRIKKELSVKRVDPAIFPPMSDKELDDVEHASEVETPDNWLVSRHAIPRLITTVRKLQRDLAAAEGKVADTYSMTVKRLQDALLSCKSLTHRQEQSPDTVRAVGQEVAKIVDEALGR